MPIDILKLIRFLVPPALIVLFTKLLGFLTGWWTTTLPDFEKLQYLPAGIVPGVIYYVIPLRRWANASHHDRVTEKLRVGLVKITGYPDKKDKYTWQKLRPLFFSLVDQDESLKQKARLAYANGAIWTSCADATALSILFALVAGAFFNWLGVEDALLATVVFTLIAVVSFFGSLACTSKHIGIGAEQLEIIEFKYKSDVEKRLNELDK
jgi:hypothetical protein